MYTRDMFDKECIEMRDMLNKIYYEESDKNKKITIEQIPDEVFTKLFEMRINIKQADINCYTEETHSDLMTVYKFADIIYENKNRMDKLLSDIANNTIEQDSTLKQCETEIYLCKGFIIEYLTVIYYFIKDVAEKVQAKEEPVRKRTIIDIFKGFIKKIKP